MLSELFLFAFAKRKRASKHPYATLVKGYSWMKNAGVGRDASTSLSMTISGEWSNLRIYFPAVWVRLSFFHTASSAFSSCASMSMSL